MSAEEKIKQLRSLDGVQYAVEHGSKIRVVFNHNAESSVIRDVEDITECTGALGGTQEHLPCIDYPKETL